MNPTSTPAPTPASPDLKTWLAGVATRRPSFAVAAPELGDGYTVDARHLTLADRLQIQATQDGDGKPADKLLSHLAVCLAGPDGGRLFDVGDPLLLCLPASLAERVVVEAMRVSSGGVAEAKKA